MVSVPPLREVGTPEYSRDTRAGCAKDDRNQQSSEA
jgi:hypothetical protein